MENQKIKIAQKFNAIYRRFDSWLYKISQDKVQYRAIRISIVITALIWLVFTVFMLFCPLKEKVRHYNTIQISLDSPSKSSLPRKKEKDVFSEKKIEESVESQLLKTEPIKSENNNVVQKSSEVQQNKAVQTSNASLKNPQNTAQNKVSKNQQKTAQKIESSKKSASSGSAVQQKNAAAPQKPKEYAKATITYKNNVEDAFNAQLSSGKNNEEKIWNEKALMNARENVSEQNQKSNVSSIDNNRAFAGSAGTVSRGSSIGANSNDIKKASDNTVSSKTADALNDIMNMKPISFSQGISSLKVKSSKDSSTGKTSIDVSGVARILISPSSPKIYIDDELARLIDSSREVRIKFTVLASGNVPRSSVIFEPEAVLPVEIRTEIAAQLAVWRFSPANSDGQARFEYSIIKR